MITGKYIKELREAAHLTQTELARLANISQAHIAKIENERVDPRLSTVNAILIVLQKKERKKTCGEVMSRKMVVVRPDDNARKAVNLMKSFGISQLPVMERGKVMGSISEGTVLKHIDKNLAYLRVHDIMDEPFPVLDEEDPAEMARDVLEFRPAVLVGSRGKVIGIITKFDLLGAR